MASEPVVWVAKGPDGTLWWLTVHRFNRRCWGRLASATYGRWSPEDLRTLRDLGWRVVRAKLVEIE